MKTCLIIVTAMVFVAAAALTSGCSVNVERTTGYTPSPSSYEAEQAADRTAEYRHQSVEPDVSHDTTVEGTPAPDR
ncbi:MAG: hypothetical protein ABFD92_11045 [Planctomycetaceae bacterium]|nr:hypothetical protein [Planctomycetaceae bacterium]